MPLLLTLWVLQQRGTHAHSRRALKRRRAHPEETTNDPIHMSADGEIVGAHQKLTHATVDQSILRRHGGPSRRWGRRARGTPFSDTVLNSSRRLGRAIPAVNEQSQAPKASSIALSPSSESRGT